MYIQGIGSISAQKLNARQGELQMINGGTSVFHCVEPDYKELIPPMQLRRMSKVVRIGIAAAKAALLDAGLEKIDMITTGTAYGCLADTEIFLSKLLQQDEQMLTPTAFIQSTHNTVSGQIALLLGCHGHNFTYVHRGHSWESALQEALLFSRENAALQILCGGIDEMTNHSHEIIKRFGTYKKEEESIEAHSDGTVAGEGSHLFVMSAEHSPQSYARVQDICLCNTHDTVSNQLQKFLSKQNLLLNDIALVMSGDNGDIRYGAEMAALFGAVPDDKLLKYKRFCGEYPTSGSFGMALAASAIKHQQLPRGLNVASVAYHGGAILLHNHYKNQYHSFILLQSI
jgi:3-oxoacyl-[acyl-carrier-protein] synthase II